MNQIIGDPNKYDFGYDFNYALWTANTTITLTNVPWNNDYRDVVSFSSTNDLNSYIDRNDAQNVTISKSMYAKANEPINIDAPFNVANQFNYVRAYNPAQPVHGAGGNDVPKYFYYFITDVRYVAPNTTQIVVQLDVWQTYIRQVQFGRCYIERGHIGVANEDQFRNYGRDYLTIPEGLDTGSNYMVVDKITRQIMSMTDKGQTAENAYRYVGHSVLIASTIDLEKDPGTEKDPKLHSAMGGSALGVASGASFYIFKNAYDFMLFMQKYSQFPWVTQGITSITLIPDYRRYYGDLGARLPFGGYKAPQSSTGRQTWNLQDGDFRDRADIVSYIPPRYRGLKKFFTFPYLGIRVASNTGQQVILQPEMWNSVHGEIREMATLMPPSARISLVPLNYNSRRTDGINDGKSPNGDGMDRTVSMSNFPTLPIVNDGAILYMAQNAHSLSYGYQSADWSQQRALAGNQASYDNAGASMQGARNANIIGNNADISATGIGNQLASDSMIVRGIAGTLSSGVGGAGAGPAGIIAGAAAGAGSWATSAIQTGMQNDANNSMLVNRLAANNAQTQNAQDVSGYIRDTNKGLADWAARGDYENQIAGMNAKIHDAQLSPPSMSGQMGGELMNLVNDVMEFRIEFIMPDQASISVIGEYWLRYGYAVNRFSFIPDNLLVMTKFSYWKLKETYIRAAGMPELFKQAIRGILEKGVTVWADPDDIGMIDPVDNKPIAGITLEGYVPPEPTPDPEPEPPKPVKRKQRKMIVFSSIDDNPATPGNVWALAGTSPGTEANWLETRDAQRALDYQKACDVDNPVGIPIAEFRTLKLSYLSPVQTQDVPAGGGA